jgi:hypothetical protein
LRRHPGRVSAKYTALSAAGVQLRGLSIAARARQLILAGNFSFDPDETQQRSIIGILAQELLAVSAPGRFALPAQLLGFFSE